MLIVIIILGLRIPLFIWRLRKSEIQNATVFFAEKLGPVKEQQLPIDSQDTAVVSTPVADMMFTNIWWNKLNEMYQLQLPFALCQEAQPVWGKYTALNEVAYHISTTSPANKIDNRILHTAIDEIILPSQLQFPDKNNKKIVIAMAVL